MPISPIYASRLKTLQTEVEDIYEKMSGKKEEITIELDPTTLAAARSSSKTLIINPLFLVLNNELEEVMVYRKGPKFQFSFVGLQNWIVRKFKPKGDIDYEKLDKWVATKFDLSEDKCKNMAGSLFFLRNSPKFRRIARFLYAHEMAHIFHEHQGSSLPFRSTIITSSSVAFYLFSALQPLLAAAVSIAVFIVSVKAFHLLYHYMTQDKEKEADLTALLVTKDYEAAECFFKFLIVEEKLVRAGQSWLSRIFLAFTQPEQIFPITHPSPQARIDYLKAAQKA